MKPVEDLVDEVQLGAAMPDSAYTVMVPKNTRGQLNTTASQFQLHHLFYTHAMSSFPQFSSLPPELQTQIWHIAIAAIPSRTISIRDRFTHPGNVSTLGLLPPRPPALLHACRASRMLAMRDRYSCAFAYKPMHSFVWMDFETDKLDIANYFLTIHPDMYNLKRLKATLGGYTVMDGYSYREHWLRDLMRRTNLREIDIVLKNEDLETWEGIWHKYKWPCERDKLRLVDPTGRVWTTEELDRVILKWREETAGAPEGQLGCSGRRLRELADE